jgi:hypothetical protein
VKERCALEKNGPTAPVPRCQTMPGPMCGLGCRTGVGQPTEPPILAGGGWQPAWECLPHLGVRSLAPSSVPGRKSTNECLPQGPGVCLRPPSV